MLGIGHLWNAVDNHILSDLPQAQQTASALNNFALDKPHTDPQLNSEEASALSKRDEDLPASKIYTEKQEGILGIEPGPSETIAAEAKEIRAAAMDAAS